MSIEFSGIQSVLDRTIFTKNGPIVKEPLPVLTGSNLIINTPTDITIPTGTFSSSIENYLLKIEGSPNQRNDGTFIIKKVLSQTKVRLLDSNLDVTNISVTTNNIVNLVNKLKLVFNRHIIDLNTHGSNDSINTITSNDAVDIYTALVLINEIRSKFSLHIETISGVDPVHKIKDEINTVYSPIAKDFVSALILTNELRQCYESHRQDVDIHYKDDTINRINTSGVSVTTNSGSYCGPFTWTIYDPRYAQIASDPSDVSVYVNGNLVSIDAVFGLLGAIVLTNKPGPTDTVNVDYNYMYNPPTKFKRLNSYEFLLNQDGNDNISGFPDHQYRIRSYIPDPTEYTNDIQSAFNSKRINWRYKGIERAYTAVLNDPSTLLLNVPSNCIMYPVLDDVIQEVTIRYDPVVFPQNSTDPWTLNGEGTISIQSGSLVIKDDKQVYGSTNAPPFYSHVIDIKYENILSSAFRVRVDSINLKLDGVFTGVGFGVSDGLKAAVVGFIQTEANNLSSAIVLANQLKYKFGSHLIITGSHRPNDTIDTVDVVDATSLQSLIILVNRIKYLFNNHISLGQSGNIHIVQDTVNVITLQDAVDLSSSIELVNGISLAYNSHIQNTSYHYNADQTNNTSYVKQVGILKINGYPELNDGWDSYAVDWTQYVTYRLVRYENGNVSLFLNGDAQPSISVSESDLPITSELDIRFNELQQVFFGSVGKESMSTSYWNFSRININPLNYTQIGDNKSVSYIPNYTPELDPISPWIELGQSGFSRSSYPVLISDSTASTSALTESNLGFVTGAYRGYTRLEPIISQNSVIAVEFRVNFGYWTFGVGNRTSGVFIDDGFISTHFVFLQASPTPATVTGVVHEPLSITSGDNIILSLDDNIQEVITFTSSTLTVSDVSSYINSIIGFTFASSETIQGFTYLKLTNNTLGSISKFSIIGGTALPKLGVNQGSYFGKDYNIEPKISWFGSNFPDSDSPSWSSLGDQSSEMLNRTLRITDNSIDDYKSYNLSDVLYTYQAIPVNTDWKLDARLNVLSYQAGYTVNTGSNLRFCGVVINVDEGSTGKNIELHTSLSINNVPYISILSFNSETYELESRAEYPFNWSDGLVHTYNIYTSKNADLVIILVDNIVLGNISYSGLNNGISVPSISFGSGSEIVGNADLRTSKSVVDWSSVCIFSDTKVNNSYLANNRYIGIYNGGRPDLLSSYYIHQIDWTLAHVYKLIRDPSGNASVYVDNNAVPVISVNYDITKLPPSSSSFLNTITNNNSCIAFGSFDFEEISRSMWYYVNYSVGKMTVTNRIVPNNNVINQCNIITSPDHLKVKDNHSHYGFISWSGGTPDDEFLSNDNTECLVLGEGTPPVPMTYDLQSRGGLIKNVTPISDINTVDLVNTNGYLSDYFDDNLLGSNLESINTLSYIVSTLINQITNLQIAYTNHIHSLSYHMINDTYDDLVNTAPIDIPTCITSILELANKFKLHALNNGDSFHMNVDLMHTGYVVSAVDLLTAQILTNVVTDNFINHSKSSSFHIEPDAINIVTGPDAITLNDACSILNEIKSNFNHHIVNEYYFSSVFTLNMHSSNDLVNIITSPDAISTSMSTINTLSNNILIKFTSHLTFSGHNRIDINNSISASLPFTTSDQVIEFANELKTKYNNHLISNGVHFINDAFNTSVTPLHSDDEIAYALLNQLKSMFNSHTQNANLHINVESYYIITSPDATDLSSAIVLTNEILSKFNTHLTGTPYTHLILDFDDVVSITNTNDETYIFTASQLLKYAFNTHMTKQGVHGNDDTINNTTIGTAVDLTSAMSLLNNLKLKYSSHITQIGVHINNDTSNILTTPNATDLILSIQLASELINSFNNHISSFSVHTMIDTHNRISINGSPSGHLLTVSDVVWAANTIKNSYTLHLINIEDPYHASIHSHGMNDTINTVTASSVMKLAVSYIEELREKINSHELYNIHNIIDTQNQVTYEAIYNTSNLEHYDYQSVYALLESLSSKYNSHLINNGIHLVQDIINTSTYVTSDITTIINSVQVLKQKFNSHIRGRSYHIIQDVSFSSHYTVDNILLKSSVMLNVLKENFNNHVSSLKSHIISDLSDTITISDTPSNPVTSDIPNMCILANSIKSYYSQHRNKYGVHLHDDNVNIITASDSSDLESLITLINDLIVKLSAHGTQNDVHGSTVIIKLDPLSDTKYDMMEFFRTETGVSDLVSPILDQAHCVIINTITSEETTFDY